MNKFVKGLAMATALTASFATLTKAEEPKMGGTLITVLGSNVRNLNSAVQSGIVTGFPGAQLFASPLRYDENWTPRPYLAESWNISEDGLTVTLNRSKTPRSTTATRSRPAMWPFQSKSFKKTIRSNQCSPRWRQSIPQMSTLQY